MDIKEKLSYRTHWWDVLYRAVYESACIVHSPNIRTPINKPLGISQYSPSRPIPSMDDQKYGPGLFRDKILKIEELKTTDE